MTTALAEYGSDAWQADRVNYIGASDVPAVLGMSPYGDAYDVWLAKKHGIVPAVNAAMEMGHLLEPVVAELYKRRFPDRQLASLGTMQLADSRLRATIDRMVITDVAEFPLEIKSTSAFLGDKWGEEGSDEVPDHVNLQVQTQLLVLNKSFAHVAVLVGGNDFRAPYIIEADAEIQQMIVDGCEAFWARYMDGDEEPLISGPNTEQNLKRKYSTHNDLMLAASSAADALVLQLAEAKQAANEAEAREKEAKTQLMGIIGSNKGLISSYGRITWAETKGRESIDTKELIAHLNVPASVLQSFTKIGAPYRTFRYTPKKSN